jgi:prepilin-type processing-associated H-X9-DG protein
VNVADGAIDLDFGGVVGDAIVSAVVIIPNDIPAAMIPYSGLADYPTSPLREAMRAAWNVRSQANLRNIGTGMFLWANDHRGRFPASFEFIGGYAVFESFANPRVATRPPRGVLSHLEEGAWAEAQNDYVFHPAWRGTTGPRENAETTILVYENPDTTPYDDLNVLYADGHVGVVTRSALIAEVGGAAVAPPEPPRPVQTAVDPNVLSSQANLRTLSDALREYANDHRARYPTALGLLYPAYGVTADTFHNSRDGSQAPPPGMMQDETRAWIDASTDYAFLAAGRFSYRAPVVAHENPAEMGLGVNLLFDDGRVEFREMRWALETIAAAKARMNL